MASIMKRGKSYRVQIRKNGITKTRSFSTKTEAASWAKALEKQIDDDLIIPSSLLLKDALDRFEPKGRDRYIVSVWSRHPLAIRDMSRIKPVDIATYRDEELRKGKAPKTIRNHVSIISQVFQLAVTEWGFSRLVNPVKGVKLPRNRQGRDRRPTDDEEERLLKAARQNGNPHIYPAIILAIETAMRQGEILAVKWKHVHLDQRYISLPADITKTNRARSVPLSSGAIELLRSLPRGKNEDRVVESNRPALRSAWIRVVANAGIADMRFHDLRHHATSRLFEKGAHSGEGDR